MSGLPPGKAGQESGGGGGGARGEGEVNDGVVHGAEERPGGEGCIGRVEGLGGVQRTFPASCLSPETRLEQGEGGEESDSVVGGEEGQRGEEVDRGGADGDGAAEH